jgi:hypothetical protein
VSKYCHKVNLEINQDWAPILARTNKMFALEDKAKIEPFGDADHYVLGSMGTISKHKLSKKWYRLTSPIINKSMPWVDAMLTSMEKLKPDDGCISYLNGSGGQHIDFPHLPTSLNFIISSTDTSAFTWVQDDDTYETYPSEVNTAWLLNTQKTHGIENSGERWCFSIHFGEPYHTVKEWFDAHPNLKYGNTL